MEYNNMTKAVNLSYQDRPLYNIRILRSYINYVQNNYPNINIDKILDYAGVSWLQFNDDGYWCNQGQMNRLQKILVNETGNGNIARDTGRSLVSTQKILALYVFGFTSPENVAKKIITIHNKLSKAAIIEIKHIENTKYEFITIPGHGVKEELYQCKNRMGSFEGLIKLFLPQYPRVEHPECLHKGGECCRYIVSWEKPSNVFKWSRIRIHSIFGGMLVSVFTYFYLPFNYFILTSLGALAGILALTQKVQKLEKDKLNKNIKELGKTAEELLDELNIRYNVAKLVQEVGDIASVLQNEKEISSAICKAMSKRLDYERGVIFLANSAQECLFFIGGYGFSDDEITLLNNVEFSLIGLETENRILAKVFKEQEPIAVKNLDKISALIDPEYLKIVHKLKILSIIGVPIVHEGKSLGVMAVDSLKSQREFRESDKNLLMAVASQTALNIAHARAYQKLQESETKHRTFIETIRDIVYTIDLEGRFTYVSPMVEVITGYTDSELYERQFIEIVSPQYKDVVMHKLGERLKTGGTSTYQIEILIKDGTTIPVELNVAPLTDTMGQAIGRIGVARDIRRRFLEEAIRQEMEVKALAQDKLASLGEIATGIAHEINQPLSYIKIILESTLDDISKNRLDKMELTDDFQESLKQVGKISNIISHLRTFGRSDVTSFGPVSLLAVINDTLILMKERLRVKNISFDMRMAENLPMVFGNHIKLEQVFLNLIQNSMDALEEAGKGKLSLSAEVENDAVLIRFSDSGSGIASDLQEKIFEPFFTTKEAGKGTGIGLSIVYGIIQEHMGIITCESEYGEGAAFKIKLPIYIDANSNSMSLPLNA